MQSNSKTVDVVSVREHVLNIVAALPTKITPFALDKIISEKYGLSKKQIKTVIRDLVSAGELIYTYEYGSTFLVPSFNKPVRVSTHVVLTPPGDYYQPESEDVVVQIKPGASFGDGRHPTSRLAIRGIEYLLKKFESDMPENQSTVLDIGTGSGILVLTAVGLGIHKGLGIDIDPSARSEAKENILLNCLEDRIEISDRYLETIDGSYYLVTANLRYPTLKKICSCLRKITKPKGFVVFSGIRRYELPDLIKTYSKKNFDILWLEEEQDWVSVVFQKGEAGKHLLFELNGLT
jgi:ribosomal protein L11 methyltransferase